MMMNSIVASMMTNWVFYYIRYTLVREVLIPKPHTTHYFAKSQI